MPQAATHLLVPLIIGSWIKDQYDARKRKKKFPLHYVLIAGIGGILPDIDIAVFYILHFFGFTIEQVHRTFTHTLFVPIIFLLLSGIFSKIKTKPIGRKNLKWEIIFLMLSLGTLTHLILDAIICGQIMPLYPFFHRSIGLNLVKFLPEPLRELAMPSLDGGLLILWIIYLEWKHKVSDFI